MATKAARKSGRKKVHHLREQSKTKLAILVLVLLFVLILLGNTIRLIQGLNRPITSIKGIENSTWDKESNINVVIKGNSISILSYNPIDEKVTTIKLPDELYINVPGGFGKWQLRSIYDLGESEKKGEILLKRSIQSFLSVPIDRYIILDNQSGKDEDIVKLFKQNPLKIYLLSKEIKSNLTPVELIKLSMGILGVRFDKVENLSLLDLDLVDQSNLADGTVVFFADPYKLDSLSPYFVENKITEERLTVAVYNATSYPGLAQKVSRIITNMGGNVIMAANAEKNYPNSFITGDSSSGTYKRLKAAFVKECPGSPFESTQGRPFDSAQECDKISQDLPELSSRAQINLVLGENILEEF